MKRYADVAAVKPSVLRASEYYKQGLYNIVSSLSANIWQEMLIAVF